jgi:hypothetical protein
MMARAAALLLALYWAEAPAAASPVVDPFLGGPLFTGPTHPHAAAIYYNPAALALDPGTHVYLCGALRYDRVSIDRASIDPATGEPGGSRELASASLTTLTPGGLVGAFSDFNGSRITLGFAVYAPFVERFADDADELRYHSAGGGSVDIFYTPSVAFRVNRRLVVGFGVSVVSSSLRLGFDRDTALEAGTAGLERDCGGAPCGAENPLAAQRYRIAVNSFLNVSGNLGGTLQTKAGWVFGASVTSPPGAFGRLEVESPGDVQVTAAAVDGGGELTGRARVGYRLPWSLRAGARGPVFAGSDYELVAQLAYLTTSRQEVYDVRMFGGNLVDANVPERYPRHRGLEDVVVVETGIEGRDHRAVRLGARLRVETPGVPVDKTSPMTVEGWNLGATGGAELRPTRELAISIAYAASWYPDRAANPSAFDPGDRIACIDAGTPLDACRDVAAGLGIPTAAGDYRRLEHAFALGLRYDWF